MEPGRSVETKTVIWYRSYQRRPTTPRAVVARRPGSEDRPVREGDVPRLEINSLYSAIGLEPDHAERLTWLARRILELGVLLLRGVV